MALTEKSIISKIEVLEDGQIQVQRANLVLRDGVEIARTYHRHVLVPGDSLATENERVIVHAKVAWTPQVLSNWAARKTLSGE